MSSETSNQSELNVVTGAFGYTGKYIARRLLADGIRVKTLTGHPERPNPFGGEVVATPSTSTILRPSSNSYQALRSCITPTGSASPGERSRSIVPSKIPGH